VAAARGTLSLSHTQRWTIRYKIAAPQTEARRLILELPKQSGWTLADPAEDKTPQTTTAYRIGVDLQPAEGKTVTVVLQRTDWQQTGITAMKSDDIVAVTSTAEIDGKAKRALEELLRRRQTLADKDAAQQQIKDESQAISNDQQRIRANLVNLNRDGGLYKRYTEKLNEQETRLEKLQELAAAAAQDWRAAKAALDDYVAKLEL
jgi:selenocysteine-specific translation elongation factor